MQNQRKVNPVATRAVHTVVKKLSRHVFSLGFVPLSPLLKKGVSSKNDTKVRSTSPHGIILIAFLLFLLFFTQYANAYNPGALFFTGFGGGVQILPQGVGEVFWLEGPLWIFAVIGISQRRHISRQVGFAVPALLAIWFITFPIGSSLTMGSPHELRTYNFLPLPEILAGYGAVVAWEMLGQYRWKWFSAAPGALALSVSLQ